MQQTENFQQVTKEYQKYNSSLGILPVAFRLFKPDFFKERSRLRRMDAAKVVAVNLNTSAIEILLLDKPTALLTNKREIIMNDPETLFGKNYPLLLKFSEILAGDRKSLKVDKKKFEENDFKVLKQLELIPDHKGRYLTVMKEKIRTDIRNRLPYNDTRKVNYDLIAKQIMEGIMEVFSELVDDVLPYDSSEYKERVALSAGVAGLEILADTEINSNFEPRFIQLFNYFDGGHEEKLTLDLLRKLR